MSYGHCQHISRTLVAYHSSYTYQHKNIYGCVVSAWSRWLFWRGLGQHRVTSDAAAPSSHSDFPVKNNYWAIHVPQQVHMLGIWGGAVPYYEVSSYTWGHLASLACREMPTAVSSLFQAESPFPLCHQPCVRRPQACGSSVSCQGLLANRRCF